MQNTPNFNLPLYEGPDIANLLTGYNQAVTEIDTAMQANKQQGNQNGSTIQQHTGQLNKLNTEMETLQNEVNQADLPGMQSDINTLKNVLTSGKVVEGTLQSRNDLLIDYGNIMTYSWYHTYNSSTNFINVTNYTLIKNAYISRTGFTELYYPVGMYWTKNIFNLQTNTIAGLGLGLLFNNTENKVGTCYIMTAYDGSNTYIGLGTVGPITVNTEYMSTGQLTISKELVALSVN